MGEPVTAAQIDALQSAIGGKVSRPGDPGYDEAVNIWNGAITARPALTVSCTSSEDVAAALAFAELKEIEVSVRGGGHNYAGFALCDGGLMIDLSPMKAVHVDPSARRARCGGGTTWGALDAASQAHGLAVPGGFISHTGVAGLTLGGGIGWLSRLAGLSSDNLVGATVVTADRRRLHVSDASHPDLFWALRGGGGNFGVVTEFEFALHRVGPIVHLGLFLFTPDAGRDLFAFAREYVGTLPDDCGVFLAGMSAPPEPFVPAELHFSPMYGLALVGFDDEAHHRELIAPVTAALRPAVEVVTSMPYVALQSMFDASAPWGVHAYEKAVYLSELSDGAIDTILEHQGRKASPLSFVPMFVLGGAYGRKDGEATAFGGRRDIRYVVNISAATPTAEGFAAEREWVRAYWSALVEHSVGVGSYVNFMSEYEENRVRAAYGAKYDRLQRIKAIYDPDNMFHRNANILPS